MMTTFKSTSNSLTIYLAHFQPVSLRLYSSFAFSALTLLVGRQEGHPAHKNWVVGCWRSYLSGARCRLAYGPVDATATHCLFTASVKSTLAFPFWYRLTWVVPDKGPLYGCVSITLLSIAHHRQELISHEFYYFPSSRYFFSRRQKWCGLNFAIYPRLFPVDFQCTWLF